MPEERRAALSFLNEPGPPLGKDNLLSAIETGLEPFALVFSLWMVAIAMEGDLPAPYLILSVLLFAITFPGTPRLGMPLLQLVGEVLVSWFWTASLLALTGFATGYEREFSRKIILTWVVAAPFVLISAHFLLRLFAPFLVSLQGPPRRAIIVGMNEQGVALASRVGETP
jgi:putative colanic acid biosynthesis UDP-glucose lipid carrier transferase